VIGRLLGLDLGTVRIGLALSDLTGLTAQPAGVMVRTSLPHDLARLAEYAREHDVERVIVGHPRRLSGEAGPEAARAAAFAAKLSEALGDVPVELWDERLTTAEALRTLIAADVSRKRRRQVVDAMAAALILQGWMDARRTAQGPA
jgi:putative Holliday junction resolvase